MKHTSRLIAAGMLAICLAGHCLVASGEEFHDLVKHIPDSANALVLVDAESVFSSPVAKAEGWDAKREDRFSSGLTSIPPKASKLVLGANVDIELMTPNWEAAVVEMESQTLMSTLGRRFDGSLGKINDTPTLRLPDDSFILRFSDRAMGAIRPGNRQQVARWINQVHHAPAEYLQQGIRYADANAQVIMLLDLEHAFSPDDLNLGKLDALQNSKVDRDELDKLIASVKGVMLGLAFRDKAYARLKFDFGQDASIVSDIAKPLFLDIIGSYGVMLDEMSDWKAEVKGKSVYLGGELKYDGLTRLASLTRLPTSALQHTGDDAAQDQPAATERLAIRSCRIPPR